MHVLYCCFFTLQMDIGCAVWWLLYHMKEDVRQHDIDLPGTAGCIILTQDVCFNSEAHWPGVVYECRVISYFATREGCPWGYLDSTYLSYRAFVRASLAVYCGHAPTVQTLTRPMFDKYLVPYGYMYTRGR